MESDIPVIDNYKKPKKYKSKNNLNITIDLDRDKILTKFSKATLKRGYLLPDEKSPQEAFARASCAFADDSAHAQRLYNYCSLNWFGFATPLLANAGTKKGLPISCFLNHVDDSRKGLMDNYDENIWLSTNGGGIGTYFGNIRSLGTKTSSGNTTTGIMPFLKCLDTQILAYKQGEFRRGSMAIYLDISHPEIEEFVNMRKPSGGDVNRKCLNLHHAVNITNKFMKAVINGSDWKLIDPHTNKTKKVVSARKLFDKILRLRVETGEPYIHFIDTTNEALPKSLKERGLKVHHSNLCSEITLPTNSNRTAICCLSSINVELFDDWKDHPTFIQDVIRMLDNALDAFVSRAEKVGNVGDEKNKFWRAIESAKKERSIGLGQMGLHYYLQKKSIPFESAIAVGQSRRITKHIYDLALEESKKLAKERGEAPDMKGTGLRFAHMISIAPTASNSIICGTTPSVEPMSANAYTHKTTAGSFYVENKYLREVLERYGKNNKKVWADIYKNDGSVQHLEWMEQQDKDIFKTSIELNQNWIIEHAAKRQEFICQSQSINLFFYSDVHIKYLADVHVNAWKNGLKTLYYCRSQSIGRTGKLKDSALLSQVLNSDCVSCEG